MFFVESRERERARARELVVHLVCTVSPHVENKTPAYRVCGTQTLEQFIMTTENQACDFGGSIEEMDPSIGKSVLITAATRKHDYDTTNAPNAHIMCSRNCFRNDI